MTLIKYTIIFIYSIFISLFFSMSSVAKELFLPMDLVSWEYKGDKFSCSLSQTISQFGAITFVAKPKQPLGIQVQSYHVKPPYERAILSQVQSPWALNTAPITVDEVDLDKKSGQVSFYTDIELLLEAMAQGNWLGVRLSSSNQNNTFDVTVPSVNMTQAMADFNLCRAKLPAMAYQDARDVVLQFKLGQRVVSSSQKQILADLASYLKHDKNVKRVLIDGHTDNVGSNVANLQISKIRADDVASILRENGVRSSLMEIRSHGSRYPVANNNTQDGKAKNRRVTIRAIRKEDAVKRKGS
ncbi:OmpA family protein [Photobacterium sp. GB-1]|nr:OmpA family protein [Photobacterium sp. GB-1]